ncbi:hypothetical protein T458_05355 [Brevibacillus panacihumi W25]|uniref:Uncharacterized protein n=1 Tax=Brevibacillus panacihumi W25 TaxID=1408254 RepID=V6MB05_9BACL|nr:hypothetical protein T458_05355 [Brevibacillus panacihumi W25]
MNFSSVLLRNELRKRSKKAQTLKSPTKHFYILDCLFNRVSVDGIDFDMFSTNDINCLLEATRELDDERYEDELYLLWYNPFYEYTRSSHIMSDLHHSKEKIYPSEDDFI